MARSAAGRRIGKTPRVGPDRTTGAARGSGVRVELVDAAGAPTSLQHVFDAGDPGPVVAALAGVPELLGPTLAFVEAALGDGAVGGRLKQFAVLRASALQGCSFFVEAHTVVALDLGLTDSEVHALRGEGPLEDAFQSEAERALIGWIDALAGATGAIPDDVWQIARSHWPEGTLIELTVTVGATMMLSRFATGLQLPTSAATAARLDAAGFG